jgi:hypothetical protein
MWASKHNQPTGALKSKSNGAAKMQTDKIFDPKYSSTIAAYSQGISDEVDIVDKKYIEFFQGILPKKILTPKRSSTKL